MKELDLFSRYLNDLFKEKKFENVLLSFEENSARFSQQDISENVYLINNLLSAFKQTSKYREGIKFFTAHKNEILEKNKFVYCTYGWLIYNVLKEEITAPDNDASDYQNLGIEVLFKLDLQQENEINLFTFLLSTILRLEKARETYNLDIVLRILKGLDFRNNEILKNSLKSDKYIVPSIISIFRKREKFSWAISFLDILQIDPLKSTKECLNSFGWLVYSKLKKEFTSQEESIESVQEEMNSVLYDLEINPVITSASMQTILDEAKAVTLKLDFTDKYSPFSKLFQLILKVEKRKSNPDWNGIIEYLDKIECDRLSLECEKMEFEKNGKVKVVELASDKELWYSMKIKALFKKEHYEQCEQLVSEAKDAIPNFHYSNDIWYKLTIGKCNLAQGKVLEAIKNFEEVLSRKSEWFVQKELAEAYYKIKENDKALNYGIQAALNHGDRQMKSSLFFLLGEIFENDGKLNEAYDHFYLAILIRESQQWRIPNEYQQSLEKLQQLIKPEGSVTLPTLFVKLQKFWRSHNNIDFANAPNKSPNKKEGYIKVVNYENGYGFITGEDGADYYFKLRDVRSRQNSLEKGIRVSFEFQPPVGERKGFAKSIEVNSK